jgi:hypothetical protein
MELNPRCGSCKSFWKPDDTDIKTSGVIFKTCKRCRDKNNKNAEYKKQYRLEHPDKIKEQNKQYILEHADKIKEKDKRYYLEHPDKIKEQNKQYYLEHADKMKEQNKQYYLEHADKMKEQNKQYRLEHADKIKEKDKQYRLEHADKIKEKFKQYRLEHADKIKEKDKRYIADIKENNPLRYLAILQRTQIWRCMKLTTEGKKGHSIEYLGCSYEDFHKHIETKINNWNTDYPDNTMNFKNIHIDHIKPISKFNFTDENDVLDCCNYTNLQPLLVADNLSKNNRWTDENEAYWTENIKGNIEYNKVFL